MNTPQTVLWFLVGAGVLVMGFFLALRCPGPNARVFWGTAIGTRVLLLWQESGADIYRYVWEGRLLLAGWNPYLHAPDSPLLEPLRDAVWASVQHKTFSAIYPPLAEWVFAGMAAIWAAPLFFRIVFLLADIGVVVLLVNRFGRQRALIFAWNPLIIYSFAGGGHYDAFFVLLLVLAWFAWMDQRFLVAITWLGAAVAVKWMALPLLAWAGWQLVVRAWEDKRFGIVITGAVLSVAPLVISYITLSLWTREWTLQLHPPLFSQYARSAEFLPGIIGAFWEQSRYQNHWFAIPLAVAWTVIILRALRFERAAEWIFFSIFVLSPMMHAWYFTWIIPFAVMTRNVGTLAVSASGFVYFLLHLRIDLPGGNWVLTPLETSVLWLPFVVGFLVSAWKIRTKPLPVT
jgi:hypothetical protein